MREVPLTMGYVALVDDEDFDQVNQFRWIAHHRRTANRVHAVCRGYPLGADGPRTVSMHRFILGALPGTMVVHLSENSLDNRRANLRPGADFFSSFTKDENSGCWNWDRSLDPYGYGQANFCGKETRAHRVSFALHHFHDIPAGLCVMHSCDNRRCVNPAHLALGTNADNTADRVAKGRTVKSAAKITPEMVLAIRADSRTNVAIAADYGINDRSVSNIKLGKCWAEVRV